MRSRWQRRRPVLRCLLAAASLVLVSACQASPHANVTREEVMAKALEHLQTKYGRAFKLGSITWGEPWGNPLGLDGKDTVLDAYPEGGSPGRAFEVKLDRSASPLTFHDYYVVQLVAAEYEKRAAVAASAVFPGAVSAVYHPGARWQAPPDSLGANTTFEQFKAWADTNYDMEFCAVFPLAAGQDEQDVKAKVPALIAGLKKVASRGSVVVTGYAPDVFTSSRVLPAMTDEVRKGDCTNGMPAAPVGLYESWEV